MVVFCKFCCCPVHPVLSSCPVLSLCPSCPWMELWEHTGAGAPAVQASGAASGTRTDGMPSVPPTHSCLECGLWKSPASLRSSLGFLLLPSIHSQDLNIPWGKGEEFFPILQTQLGCAETTGHCEHSRESRFCLDYSFPGERERLIQRNEKKMAHCQAENRKGTGRILAFMTLVVIETEPDISIEQFGAITNTGFYSRDELSST